LPFKCNLQRYIVDPDHMAAAAIINQLPGGAAQVECSS
jgi:hypothetical protein